jgi:hypothetical protein
MIVEERVEHKAQLAQEQAQDNVATGIVIGEFFEEN